MASPYPPHSASEKQLLLARDAHEPLWRASSVAGDVEKQPVPPPLDDRPSAPEYGVRTGTKLLYLAGWFLLNLALTIYNKAVLGEFAFPWLLTALHTGSVSVGCFVLLQKQNYKLTKLAWADHMQLVAFSFLFTINIAISNVSLALVSVPFHQIMRSTSPIYTILFQWLLFSRSYSTATYLSLLPVIVGVCLTTTGDYSYTPVGLVLTVSGVVISVMKTIASNRLMTGELALPTLEVLYRLSPLAALQCVAYAQITGEAAAFMDFCAQGHLTRALGLALAGNGLIAFLLNVSSFSTNRMAGPLTLSIAGNLKQCLTIVLGIVFFSVKVSRVGGAGMALTVVGAAWYSKVELDCHSRAGRSST